MAKAPVAIKVTPQQAFAPSDVRVTVTIQPDARNAWLEVEAVCGGLTARASEYELAGVDEAITHYINWRDLDACFEPYGLTARVCEHKYCDGGRVLPSRTTFHLLGPEPSEEPP